MSDRCALGIERIRAAFGIGEQAQGGVLILRRRHFVLVVAEAGDNIEVRRGMKSILRRHRPGPLGLMLHRLDGARRTGGPALTLPRQSLLSELMRRRTRCIEVAVGA